MTTLEELITPKSPAEIEASIYASIEARGVSTTGWKDAAVIRALITGVAIVLGGFESLRAAIARGGFLELATGDWLTICARSVYGVERVEGAYATGLVSVHNTGGGVYAGDPGDLIVRTVDGRSYRNTAPFSLPAMMPDPIEIPVRAVDIGSAGNAMAGEIDRLETVLIGVTCSNPRALIGVDPESDAALRTRCRESTGALSPMGPRDAYAFMARSARREDGTAIGINRVRTVADGYGGVDVYIATPTGAAVPGDVAIVQAELQDHAEPHSVSVTTKSADPVPVAVSYDLWIRDDSGLEVDAVKANVKAALASLVESTPIGGDIVGTGPGKLHKQAIEAAISSAVVGHLVDLDVHLPAGDTDLDAHEAPTLGTVTDAVIEVPAPT